MADEAVVEPQETPAPEVIADAPPKEPVAAPAEGALEKMQKRIDELTWRLKENERRVQPEPVKPPEPVAAKAPTLEAFGFDEEKFRAAQTEYLRSETERIVNDRLSKAEQDRTFEQRTQTFREREKAYAAKHPDYAEKVYNGDTLPISDVMAEEITSSELGPEIAVYLAEHREVARNLYQLPPREVAREIGRIEAKLTASPPPVKKVSEAPPPAARIEANEPEVEKDQDQMSTEEWLKWRNKQVRRKKG